MTPTPPSDPLPPVGYTAFALGFAGLLPQLAALWLTADGANYDIGPMLALGYGGLILSFLGGMWWGIALRRTAGQGMLVALAVVPSLVAGGLVVATVFVGASWSLVGLGSAILLTLPVDRWLVATGEAPRNWMALRIPLSVGLGGLTIATGAFAP